jgi:Glycosyltransferase family 87
MADVTVMTARPRGRGRPRDRSIAASGLLWVVLALYLAGWAWLRHSPGGISWHYFTDGVGWLSGDGVHLYARHPALQVGPLTLLAVAPAKLLGDSAALAAVQLAGTALGLLVLWLATRLPEHPPPAWLVALAGALLLPAWTVLSVRWVHPDDELAVLLAVAALVAVRRERGLLAGVLLGAAVAAKPWALGFEPVLLMLPRRLVWRALVAGAVVVAAAWLPFVAGDPATLAALHPPVTIADTSVLRLFGVTGTLVPSWVRPVQLLAGPVLAYLVVSRRRWLAAPLVAFAFRLAIDPQDIGYYEASAVAFAVVADLGRGGLPWRAGLTAVALWHPFVPDFAKRDQLAGPIDRLWLDHPKQVAAIHLGWAVLVVVGHLWPRRAGRRGGPVSQRREMPARRRH